MASEETLGKKEFEERGGGLLSIATKEPPKTLTVTAQMHDHVMTVSQVPAKVFFYEPRPFVDAFEAVGAYYGMDGAMPFADVYNYEAEALGQAMIYGEHSMPTIDFRDPLIKQPGDLAKVKIPDWEHTKRVPFLFESTRLAVERGMTTQGVSCGPFSLAVGVRSYPLLMHDIKKNPKFAHELFTWLVDDVLTSFMKAFHKYAGVNVILPADAWSAIPNVTPDMLDEWVVPYDQRLQANLAPDGIFCVNMAGDYCEERLEKFDKQVLWRCFDAQSRASGAPVALLGMGRWQDYPLEAVAEYLDAQKAKGVNVGLTAGVNARLLRDGPVDAIVDNIKRFIDILGRRTHTDIFLANIPADAPPQHVSTAVQAVHTYGRLPLAENLEQVQFKPKPIGSFKDYLAGRPDRDRFKI